MGSTAHTATALTALQTRYTAAKSTVTSSVTAGTTSVAAAARADLQELQLTTTREGASALS